jgi:RNA polymerase sigma factor (sigma-70 family)
MLAAFTGIQQPATDNAGIEYVLEEALNTLPPRQRAAIALRYLEDMSNETIATTLNCSASTVKSHISRGLATLRILLPADDESEIGRQENV